MYKTSAKKGFTLIELLVVIAIIGLLSSIVFASLNTARQKARDAKRLAEIKQVMLALELYYDANNGRYPSSDMDGCGGWDTGDKDFPFMTSSGVSTLGSFMPTPPRDMTRTGNCDGYRYYRYDAGYTGCPVSKGAFYVIGITVMETAPGSWPNVYPGSPGWSCPSRNWQGEFSWVTGAFENP